MPILPSEPPKTNISTTRKILVWGFIIGFWVFFYWYNDAYQPFAGPESKKESMSENQNKPSL